MATSDDTFDPNDLDSIDALLDEAELEAVMDDPADDLPEDVSVDTESVIDEIPLEADLDDTEGLLDALDEVTDSIDAPIAPAVPTPASKVAAVAEPVREPEVKAVSPPVAERARVDEVDDTDDFVSKRAAARTNPLPQMAAQDMDSIKKLIIIFSSTLIVLVLTGIGIGVWSALAASSAGMDDETITLIESIKVNSEQGATSLSENTKSVQSVEKKLDALNFQLEQLATDLAAVVINKVEAPKPEILDPLGLGTHGVIDNGHGAVTKVADSHPKPVGATVVPAKVEAVDPAVLKKITAVNAKMIKAQRRIDEVNRRVKSIQTQYQVLLKSVKTVEKQIVMEQLVKAEKAEKEKSTTDANPYQYTAPDGMFYDQSVQDSYP